MRTQLTPSFLILRDQSEKVFEYLQEQLHSHLYISISSQRIFKENFLVNPKEQSYNDDLIRGMNIRVFDGSTMHEWAHPQSDLGVIKGELDQWLETLKSIKPAKPVYVSPSWTERLAAVSESEILSQVSEAPETSEWVHFGVPQKKPWPKSTQEGMDWLKDRYTDFKNETLKLEEKHPARVLDFSLARLDLSFEEHCFIDSSVRMTQALPRVLCVIAAVKKGERGYHLTGGLGGMETIQLTSEEFHHIFNDLENLVKAEPLPPGRYDLLMHPSVSGVFAHEAFGHSQEGDTWARGRSKAKDLYESKESVGNSHATILNNPAIYKNAWEDAMAWGSYFFDEEGWLASEQVLVDQGQLQLPMTDFVSSYRLQIPRTANGKRESWSHGIYTRQTNTYFSEGDKTFDQLLAQVKNGYYARHPYGGMEDPKGMGIQVGIGYVEEIVDGQLTGRTFKGPNGGAIQMTGYVPDYLNQIVDKSKIDAFSQGKDHSKYPWNEIGGCGKYHKESVHAGCGGPYLLVSNALLS
tara:strand:- start:113077 stop:114642 length:1566 start_codon:yes stop_codon:yes gene_type:complete